MAKGYSYTTKQIQHQASYDNQNRNSKTEELTILIQEQPAKHRQWKTVNPAKDWNNPEFRYHYK